MRIISIDAARLWGPIWVGSALVTISDPAKLSEAIAFTFLIDGDTFVDQPVQQAMYPPMKNVCADLTLGELQCTDSSNSTQWISNANASPRLIFRKLINIRLVKERAFSNHDISILP